MRLLVTTPSRSSSIATDVRHVRAEDETGAFGILHGHADFVTVLAIVGRHLARRGRRASTTWRCAAAC